MAASGIVQFARAVGAALVLVAMATGAGAAQPRARLIETSLRDGEWVDFAPFAFVISFTAPVTLEAAWLVDAQGAKTALPAAGLEGTRISVPMPVLIPHHYRLNWRGRDRTGAQVSGTVEFAIRGCPDERGFSSAARN